MKESVCSSEIYESAKISQILDLALNDHAFLNP